MADWPNDNNLSYANTNSSEILPKYTTNIYMFIFLSLLYGMISVISVVGNCLIIYVVAKNKRMQNVTNYFISNLALADIVIGMFVTPFQFQAAYLQRWIFPDIMCKIVPFAATLSVNVSIITLVAISLDRYYVILYPFRQKLRLKQCIIILFLIWIVSILMSLFKLFNYEISIFFENAETIHQTKQGQYNHASSTTKHIVSTKKICGPQNEHLDDIEVVFLAIMQYVVPFFIISFTYFRIGYHIYFDDSPSSVTMNHSANKRKVIKMIFIVVLLFMMCWAPIQLFHTINVFSTALQSYKNSHIIWFFSNCLAVSNSCYNVFIYGACSARFKAEFKKLFSCLPCIEDEFYDLDSNIRKMTITNNNQRNNSCNSQMIFGASIKKPSLAMGVGDASTNEKLFRSSSRLNSVDSTFETSKSTIPRNLRKTSVTFKDKPNPKKTNYKYKSVIKKSESRKIESSSDEDDNHIKNTSSPTHKKEGKFFERDDKDKQRIKGNGNKKNFNPDDLPSRIDEN